MLTNFAICVAATKDFDFMLPTFMLRVPKELLVYLVTVNYVSTHSFPNLRKIPHKDKIFSRSRAINIAIYSHQKEISILADIDFLIPPLYFDTLNKYFDKGLFNTKFTSGFICKLGEELSKKIIAKQDLTIVPNYIKTLYSSNNPMACSTLKLKQIGGYDERMEGWGAEDDDIKDRLIASGLRYHRSQIVIYHRFHQSPSGAYMAKKEINRKIYKNNINSKIIDVSKYRRIEKKKGVTALIKTFLRDEYLIRCVESLQKNYTSIRMVIADDGLDSTNKTTLLKKYSDLITYIKLPYNVGICEGRNAGIKKIKTEYFLYLDDDFIFTEKKESKLLKMCSFLDHNKGIDLIGGSVKDMHRNGKIRVFNGSFSINGQELIQKQIGHDKFNLCPTTKLRYQYCDYTTHYYVARTDSISSDMWDNDILRGMHSDFFLNYCKAGKTVVFSPDCVLKHHTESAKFPNYLKIRTAKTTRKFYEKHEITKWVKPNGKIETIDNDSE